jgi:hypothetical protein
MMADERAAIAAALIEARAIIAADVRDGTIELDQRIDVGDERGVIVHSLPFREAVQIVGVPPN